MHALHCCPEQRCMGDPMARKVEEGMEDPSEIEELQVPREFLNILYDLSRSMYFLDFLEEVRSAPKLLFWLEVEQTKCTPGLNNAKSTTLEKFIMNDGALLISEIGLPHEVVEFTIRLWVKGEMPGAVVFSTAQALVKYELLVVWYPRFQNSPSYAAMVNHLCNTYPLNLSQLLIDNRVRGPGTDGPNQSEEEDQGRLLQKFLSCERDVPPEVSWALQIWKVIVTSLRPLCASVYKTLSERGPEQSSQSLSHLIDELTSFKNMVLKQGAGSDPDIQRILKCIQLLDAAAKPHPISGARLGVNVVSGAVNMVSEGLLRAQQQANHLLTTQLIPALRSSSAFVEFVVEEGLSNRCVSLRAYLRVLTGMKDNTIQRAVYFPRMVTTDGNDVGGSYQFHITYPTCRPSSSCPSPFGYLLETNNLRPDLFCMGEEGNMILNNPESVVSMMKKEGHTIDPLSTLLPPRLVLCFSVCTQRRMIGAAEPDTNTLTGGLYRIVYKKETTHDNKNESDCSSSANMMHTEGKNNVEHYFNTNVTQLSHVYLANVVRQLENQTEHDPPLAHIQNPAASSGQDTSSRPVVIPSYLGSGVFPTDTDDIMEKQKEIDVNLQELLVSTNLLNQLPGYCLPSAIAVVGTQSEQTTGNQQNSSVPSSPLPKALRPSIHHFLLNALPKSTVGEEEERCCCGSVEYDTKCAYTLYGTCRTEWRRSSHKTEEDLPESEHVWLPHCMVMVTECPLVDTMGQVLMTYFKEEDHDQSPHRVYPLNSSSGTVSSTDNTIVQEEVDIQQQKQQQLAKLTLITNTQGKIPSKWNFYSAPIPALDYSICIIFKLLSPQHVLAVLQWLALERSVVVTSSSYNVVFSSCEAFRALLHPLKWQYRYAPFLPSNEIYQFATSGLSKEKGFDLLSSHSELFNNDPLSKRATTRGPFLSMDNDPFLVGMDSSLLSLVLECDDIELRMRGKGYNEKVIIAGGQENASGSLRPIFGVDQYENKNNLIRVDQSTINVIDIDEDTTQPSNDTLYLMWHLVSQALIVDLDFDELTPPSIIVKRNDPKQLSSSSSFSPPSSLFLPPPLSDPETLYFPSTLLNSTLQSIQGALFVERKTFDEVKCRRPIGPIGIDSCKEDDDKQSDDVRQRLRQMRLNDESSLLPGSEEYIIKAHTCSASNRALRGAMLEMWQSLLGDMKMFLSLDGELGICRLDSERYFSLKSEWLTRRGCSLLTGLFETQALICLLRNELLYSIPLPFASNALAKWKTAVDGLR